MPLNRTKSTRPASEHAESLSRLEELVSLEAPAPEQLEGGAGASSSDSIPTGRLAPNSSGASLLGECLDDRHPQLAGRVLVRWTEGAAARERWLPCLHGLAARTGDRVLFLRPENSAEPIVIGVVDGFARRPDIELHAAASLALKPDECLRVTTADGDPLVELSAGEGGPLVRLLRPDVALELPGALRVSAASIELRAREGEVVLAASDDVVVTAEVIHLN